MTYEEGLLELESLLAKYKHEKDHLHSPEVVSMSGEEARRTYAEMSVLRNTARTVLEGMFQVV